MKCQICDLDIVWGVFGKHPKHDGWTESKIDNMLNNWHKLRDLAEVLDMDIDIEGRELIPKQPVKKLTWLDYYKERVDQSDNLPQFDLEG